VFYHSNSITIASYLLGAISKSVAGFTHQIKVVERYIKDKILDAITGQFVCLISLV
jgi:hypothetical protein